MKLHLPIALLTAVLCSMSYAVAEVGTVAGIDRTLTGSVVEGATHGNLTVTIGDGNYTNANMYYNVKNGTIAGAAHVENGKETTLSEGNPSDIYSSVDIVVGSKDSEGPNIKYLAVEGRPVNSVAGDKSVTVNSGSIEVLYGGIVYDQGATSGNLNHIGNSVTMSNGETRYYAYKDSANEADLNITINGGTVGQIRAGHSGKQEEYIYKICKDYQSDPEKYAELMTDKPWSISGDVNVAVTGGTLGTGSNKAIMGAGGSGHSVDGNVNVDISGGVINGHVVAGGSNIYSEVGSTSVSISGGTINGNVYAGGDIDDGRTKYAAYTDAPAPTVEGNTEVVLSGGTINGSVYAAGIGDIVKGDTRVVIDGTQAEVTGVISGGGINGAQVEGDSVLSIKNSGGLGVSWDQFKDFNALEIEKSQLALGTEESGHTLSTQFQSVSVEHSNIFGEIGHEVVFKANDSVVELQGNLTTKAGSSITNTDGAMTVGGNATFDKTTISNSDIVAGGKIEFENSSMNGGTLSVGSELILNGDTNVVVDSINNGNAVHLTGGSVQHISLGGDIDLNELAGLLGKDQLDIEDLTQSGNASSGAPSLTVNSDLKLAAGSSFKGETDVTATLTANSITTEGAVTFDKTEVTATVGNVSLSSGSKVTDSSITSTNGIIALDGVTGTGTVTLNASTNGWSSIAGETTVEDLVLDAGKYQVKKDATLTADTITINATTYLDGQTTANKLTANKDTYIRYNGANIGELTINGASFAVSNGALVEVGQLTASNSLFGLDVSGTGTKVVVGDSSSDVHSVNNSRLTASNGAQLVVNGTLEGNRITVSGAVDFDKVKGDNFRYTNTGEEYNLQVNSINGNNAFLDNKNGGISISKLVTENGTVRATGDISLSTGSKVTNTELTTSEGKITLKGATLVDSSLTSTTGNIDISGKTTIDGGSIVVGGKLNISNSNVAVDSLTGTDGNGVNLRFESTFNANSLTVGSDLVLSEGSAIYGGPFGSNSSITANSISSTGKVYISGGDVTATVGDINLKDSNINGNSGSGESNLVAVNGNVVLTNTSLSHTNIDASNGVIALNGVTAKNTLNLTASTDEWSSITGETTLDDLVLVGGNLQVKKDSTFTADTVTLNGQTYIDGTATINKVVANDYLSARVNDINIGELELNGDQLSVSHGAAVTVGTLTAAGKSISVSDTTNYGSSQLIIGTDSASVHNVAGTRFAVNGESVLKVNGTLKGDGINVGGVAQIENVEGDRFRFTNTTTEGDLQVGSLTGTGAYFENRNGGVEIGKIVTENSTVKASGDITVGTDSVLAGSELNSSAGNITLTGTTATDTAIHAANGTVTLNDSYASTAAGMDAQKVVVNSGSTLDVTVHGLTLSGTGKSNDEAMVVDGTVNVTDSSLTIKGSNSQLGIGYGADSAVMNVTNSTVDLSEGTTLHIGYNANTSNSVLNIKNSEFVGGSNNAWLGGGTINVTDNSTLSVCTGAEEHYNYRVLMGLKGNTVNLNVESGSDFVSSASQFVTNFNSGTTVNINVKGEGSTFVHNNEIESAPTHGITKTTTYLLDSGTDASGNKYDAVNNVKTNITASEGASIAFNSDVTYVGSAQDKAAGYTDKQLNITVADSASSVSFNKMEIYADTTIKNMGDKDDFFASAVTVYDGATVETYGSLDLNDVAISGGTLYSNGSLEMDSLVMDNATMLFAVSSLEQTTAMINYKGADLTGYGTNNVSAADMIQNFGVVMSGADAAGLLQQWGSEVEFSFTLAQGSADFEKHFAYVLEQNLADFTITLGDVAELSVGADEIKNLTVTDTENGVVISGIAVIPEPTTATLSLLALAALAARRRRK